MVNSVARDFWSEVLDLRTPRDDERRDRSSRVRSRKERRTVRKLSVAQRPR